MEALELARAQFAITTIYHFVVVPLTIGLAPLVAIMQTAWVRTGNEKWLKLTKFFGKLFLINFALGVVTGIVQEFQFGMNWSDYSRFVGDVFGAPLAMEALAAFFIESTFIGIWIFGWGRLSKTLHLATIWLVAIAVNMSAYFILAANSWMQHPVGTIYNPETGRAELESIWAVLTNNTLFAAFSHTVLGAFLTAGTFVAGIGAWWMVRLMRSRNPENMAKATNVYRPAVTLGLITMLVSGIGVTATGDWQAKIMFEQQPMKMAAAEALCVTETGASFSILTWGDLNNDCAGVQHLITLPNVTSILADNDPNSTVLGVQDLQMMYAEKYGDTNPITGEKLNYIPNLAVTYWSFRLMIGFGIGSALLSAAALWLMRKKRTPDEKWFGTLGLVALPMPFLASVFGWVFTEVGRQPWVVHPNPGPGGVDGVWMLTMQGVSPMVGAGTVLTSVIVYTLVYGLLAVAWYKLLHRFTIEGVPEVRDESPEANSAEGDDAPLSFAY